MNDLNLLEILRQTELRKLNKPKVVAILTVYLISVTAALIEKVFIIIAFAWNTVSLLQTTAFAMDRCFWRATVQPQICN